MEVSPQQDGTWAVIKLSERESLGWQAAGYPQLTLHPTRQAAEAVQQQIIDHLPPIQPK